MNTLVILNGTNITPWIVPDSYQMESEDMFESWRDGNFVEHRIYTRSRMTGKFSVWTAEKWNMDLGDFLTHLSAATNNHVTLMSVYDATSDSMKAIYAYVTIKPAEHKEYANGKYYDVLDIEVEER